jgi:hypothetical protein
VAGPAIDVWGVVILLAGAVSALVGILYALVDHDLKRLLAFSSIENVGIILIGVGGAMLFRQAGLEALALLALVAALYHTVNHAMFKTLLFLAAGVVAHGVGTRNMEAMGGLIKRMPWTAGCFLLGAMAIAGLPPVNGFVSEWLTFQALLQNIRLEAPGLNLVFVLAIAALALTAGLGAACFVKAFGITFLAFAAQRGSRAGPRGHGHDAMGDGRTGRGMRGARSRRDRRRSRGHARGGQHARRGSGPAAWDDAHVQYRCRLRVALAAAHRRRPRRRSRGPARIPRGGRQSATRTTRGDVGMRPDPPDRAHAIHGGRLRGSVQARVPVLLPPGEAA